MTQIQKRIFSMRSETLDLTGQIRQLWCGDSRQRESHLSFLEQRLNDLRKKKDLLRKEIARWGIADDCREISSETARVFASLRGTWQSADGVLYRVWGKKDPGLWNGIDFWKKEKEDSGADSRCEPPRREPETPPKNLFADTFVLTGTDTSELHIHVDPVKIEQPVYTGAKRSEEAPELKKPEEFKPTLQNFYDEVVLPTAGVLNILLRYCAKYPKQGLDVPEVKESIAGGFRFLADAVFTVRPEMSKDDRKHLFFDTGAEILENLDPRLLSFIFRTCPDITDGFQNKLAVIREQIELFYEDSHSYYDAYFVDRIDGLYCY